MYNLNNSSIKERILGKLWDCRNTDTVHNLITV